VLACASAGCPAQPQRVATSEQIDLLCHRSGKQLSPELYGLKEFPAQQAPPGAVLLAASEGHALLAIDPQNPVYRVSIPAPCLPESATPFVTVRMCVDEGGAVKQTLILSRSLPVLDDQVPYVLGRWRYRPYLVDGRARPFCYHLNYRVRKASGQ
jgi:hypothetical protein